MTNEERVDAIHEFLSFVHGSGDPFNLVELRALGAGEDKTITWLGQDLMNAAHVALAMEERGGDVYYTLNPVFLGTKRAMNGERERPFIHARWTARDDDIQHRNLILVDIDPVRPSGTAASDSQRWAAGVTASKVYKHLLRSGWPEPVVLDSGNGVHLLYPCEEVSIDSEAVRAALKALAREYDDEVCKIDTCNFNPARIARMPWTLNKKAGRMSRVIKYPASFSRTNKKLIMDLAHQGGYRLSIPWEEIRSAVKATVDEQGITDLIDEYPEILELDRVTRKGGATWFALASCPFKGDAHEDQDTGAGKTAIVVHPGSIGFSCFAGSCAEYTFRDLIALLIEETGRAPSMQLWETDQEEVMRLAKRWGGIDLITHEPDKEHTR